MSRRRQLAEPEVVHGYWPHSDPEPPSSVTGTPSRVTRNAGVAHGTHAHPLGETPCPGQCNREFRAAEQAAQDELTAAGLEDREPNQQLLNHAVVFHPAQPAWCRDVTHVEGNQVVVDHPGCTERITADLTKLTDLATDLAPGPLNTPRDVNASSSTSSSIAPPTASPGWDTADELIRWALQLEDDLRERLGHPHAVQPLELHIKVKVPRPFPSTKGRPWVLPVWEGQTVPVMRVPPPRTLQGAIRYLTAYSTALLSGPDAEKIGRAIMRRKRQLEQGVGQDRLVHRLPGACMVCDRKGLQRKDGGDLVKCRFCGATWAWEHYELLAKAYADDVRRRGA